jgi:hypothetical protein
MKVRGTQHSLKLFALAAALGFAPIAAHAQDVCTLADDPTDRMPVENCDGCPEDGVRSTASPDGVFRLLNTVTDRGAIPIKNRKLAAIASDAVRDALRDGADVGTRFGLGDYGSIGVETKINAILSDSQTDLQKAAARNGNVWLSHSISAQAGANLGTTVPVGPHGFFVRTGLGAGATFSVKVDKAYEPRVADVARRAIVNQLTVPFAAFDAEKMSSGERVVIAGNGNIAVSGGAGYGVDLGELGLRGVRAGASVDAGAANVLSGAFETEVTKEAGNLVRVKLRTGRSNDVSGDFRAFAGVTVDRSALEIPVETGVSVIDNAVERSVRRTVGDFAERALSASFTTRHGDLDSKGDLQEYTFDLGRRSSRRAYEDALRGDFRAAAALASCGSAGVGFVREINEAVGRAYHNTNFNVSLLRYSIDSSSTDTNRTIRDSAGLRSFEIHEFAFSRRNFFGGGSSVGVAAINSMYGALGSDGKSVHLTYRGDMENKFITSKSEMKDILEIGRAIAGPSDMKAHSEMNAILGSPHSGNSFPFFWNRFGNTKMALDLTVSESGIDRIAKTSQADMWAAFAAPNRDEPRWATAEGRAELEQLHRTRNSGRDHNQPEPQGWQQYQRVKESIENLTAIGGTTDRGVRAQKLRDAAEAMGDDFTAGAALSILAGEENRSVKFGVKNEHVDYTWTRIGDHATVRPPS